MIGGKGGEIGGSRRMVILMSGDRGGVYSNRRRMFLDDVGRDREKYIFPRRW